jgi:hypothetical protein
VSVAIGATAIAVPAADGFATGIAIALEKGSEALGAALGIAGGWMVVVAVAASSALSGDEPKADSDSSQKEKSPQAKGRPKNNREQNDQAKDAIRDYQRQTGRQLSRDQQQEAHRQFGRESNPNYHDLIEILKDTFGE